MSASASRPAPTWTRVIVGLLGLMTIGFSLAPTSLLPPGLSLDVTAPLNAAYLFSSRNIAIGLGLMLGAVFAAPEAIAGIMVVRLILEISDRVAIAPLFPTLAPSNLLMVLVPVTIEGVIIFTMIRVAWIQPKR